MPDPVQAFQEAILAALGYAPEAIEPGRLQRFPTRDRRRDGAGWCKLFDDLRGGVYGCHRQGINASWSAADRATMSHAERIAYARQVADATAQREADDRRRWQVNAERNAELWAKCVPLVPGDPVTRYLKRRGIAGVWPLPAWLRLHPALPYWHEGQMLGNFPAMVAPLMRESRMLALHRTHLTQDGRKADVPTVKKLTCAAGPLVGSCIPLFKPVAGCLGIAEGIETALAASLASHMPTVAAYCADNLAAFRWPVGTQRLVIFADNDEAGRVSAERLRARALAAGLRCNVLAPSAEGSDWCDVWARRDDEARGAA